MQVGKKELMDRLGVGHELGPYETFPWSGYDPEGGRTCSAEVRMNPDGDELEAEVQMMYDSPPPGAAPMEQIIFIKSSPNSEADWEIRFLRVRGEPLGDDIYNWQEKACNFFRAVAQELQSGTIPDIDELIDTCFHNRERFGDQRQGGGGKSPKIRTEQLLKKSGGF